MPYEYLEDIATADAAFRATGKTLEEVFTASADATMNVMVEDLETITSSKCHVLSLSDDSLENLLFEFLQELIFLKDAQKLLTRVNKIAIVSQDNRYILNSELTADEINPKKHSFLTDIKAVTWHQFSLIKVVQGWEAVVVLDV